MKNDRGIDENLCALLNERADMYRKTFEARKDSIGGHFVSLKREISDYIDSSYRGALSADIIKRIYGDILSGVFSLVRPVKVAYMGPEGTYSNQAMMDFFGPAIDSISVKTISDVFHDVELSKADFGIVPIENSTEGAVTYTLDELIETELQIIAEKFIRISCSLLSKESDLNRVQKIYTHPQPLGQCRVWLRKNLPEAEICIVDSTTRAADMASHEPGSAALASSLAAELYNLNILAEHVEDSRQNYTRFFIIGREQSRPTGKDKTSIVFSIKDRPGALLGILDHFNKSGINMTKIESRPDKKKMWEYNFFIDFLGHRDDREVDDVLAKIRNDSIYLKVLGSYPVGN
ncbi:MAG TPA: prephenate dehydratase [Spirochaetota bacterium]|nr:prephenate dehydratase [Spirochaetota bacterium]HPI89677.1 prephenate dehydratase [Spirochaetota bacterium]HPR49497.1 prephenate dehydratase [Spirochaetota bacterium]